MKRAQVPNKNIKNIKGICFISSVFVKNMCVLFQCVKVFILILNCRPDALLADGLERAGSLMDRAEFSVS